MKPSVSVIVPMLLVAGVLARGVAAQQPPTATEPGAALLAMVVCRREWGEADREHTGVEAGWRYPVREHAVPRQRVPGTAVERGPSGTQSYVIIMQDPDAMRNAHDPALDDVQHSWIGHEARSGNVGAARRCEYGPNIRGASQPYMGRARRRARSTAITCSVAWGRRSP